MQNPQEVQLAVNALRAALPPEAAQQPPLALILGTGLSGMVDGADSLSKMCTVPYAAVPGFPDSGVASHAGRFVWGLLEAEGAAGTGKRAVPLLIQQGRCHLYEGRSPEEVCMGVRVMAGLGAQTLIVTNAAGALNPRFEAGDIMCLSDQINHCGASPLSGANCEAWGPHFPDMSSIFDPHLQALALECAGQLNIRLERGVYIGVRGPEMESPAETRMFRQWGADAVGMSTVLEVIAARHLGLRVLGLSCLSNKNLPDCMQPTSLAEIIAVAGLAGAKLARLLRALLPLLHSAPPA